MSIGRKSSPAAERVSNELRTESSATLHQRRLIVALSLVAGGSMGLITLYQMGMIDHLPEPSLGRLDADRARTQPMLPVALAIKVAFDALGAIFLTVEQGSKHRKFCSWCLVAAAASLAMVPAVVPETRQAWKTMRGRA